MANGLDIGRAGFSLGVSSADAIKGVTDFSNTTSRSMTRMVPAFKQVDSGFGGIDEALSKTQRGLDRWTRGLRGMDPVMASSREQMYRIEDAQRRVSREVDIARLKLVERKNAEQANVESIHRLNVKIAEQEEKMGLAAQKMNFAKLELDRLNNSTQAHTDSMAKQEAATLAAQVKLDKHIAGLTELTTKIDLAKLREQGFTDQLSQQALKLAAVDQRLSEYTNDIQIHVNQIKVLEAQQANVSAEQDLATKNIDELSASYKNFADQAQVAALRLKQMEQRNVPAELQKQNAAVRTLNGSYVAADKSANKLQGQLSAMARAGQQSTQAYKDLAIATRAARATADGFYQSKEIAKARVEQLRLEEKNYSTVLKEQASEVDLLNAKAATEKARMTDAIGDLTTLKARRSGLVNTIQDHKNSMEQLRIAEASSTIQRQQELRQLDILEGSHKAAIATRQRMEAELAKQQVSLKNLTADYAREDTALKTLVYSGKAAQSEIDAQQKKVDELSAAYKREATALGVSERAMDENVTRHHRLARETEAQEQKIKSLTESENRYGAQVDVQKGRIQALTEKMQKKKEKQDQVAASSNKVTSAMARQGEAAGRSGAGFASGASSVDRFGASQRRLINISDAVNRGMMRTSSIIRDVLVGSVTNFIGNTLSALVLRMGDWASTGLQAFKSNEMLAKSLTALSARELMATGNYKDLNAAQGDAAKQSAELVKWMEKLAIQSPFSVDDISGAFRLGNALGFTSAQTKRLIRDTTDWATATGGTGQSIESVIRALGQMNSTGHVTLEDLNQMTDAGLGARDVLRNAFAPEIKASGKSLEDLISAGLIPADRAIEALSSSMENDFGGAAASAGGSMTGLLNSLSDLKSMGLRELMSGMFKAIQGPLESFVGYLQAPATLETIRTISALLGDGLGSALSFLSTTALPAAMEMFRRFGPIVFDALAAIGAVASEAYEWGYAIGEMLAQGLSDTIDLIVSIINEIASVIGEWMEPHSPPKFLPHIMEWGRKIGELYFNGMGSADPRKMFSKWVDSDFGILDKVKSQLGDALSGLVDLGQLDGTSAISMVMGTQEEVARAITQFRMTGSVTEEAFDRIRSAAGPAGDQMVEYTRAIFASQGATDKLVEAQRKLDQITKAYDAKIDPLRAKLKGLQDAENKAARDAQRKQLQDLLSFGAENPGQVDMAGVQRDLDKLNLEDQIATEEAARDAAIAAQQAKVDAALSQAEAAAKELAMLENLIAVEKEQMELAKARDAEAKERAERDRAAQEAYAFDKLTTAEQIDVLKEKRDQEQLNSEEWIAYQRQIEQLEGATANDQAARDAAAKERYTFDHMSAEEQLAYLREKQTAERAESEAWFEIQNQIEQKQEEIARANESRSSSSGAAAKEATNYEDEYNRSVGETADRLAEVQKQLADAEPGTKEYFRLKKEENKLTEQLNKEKEKEARATGKASEADFDHQLKMSDKADTVDLLRKRMEELDPESEEYRKRSEQLKKAEEDQAKATDQLSNAEFEAKLATQDRTGKIAMLQERLGGLNKGTLEYERTLKRLNTLEASGGGGGRAGGAGGKGKAGPISGSAFKGLDEVKEKFDELGESTSNVMEKIEGFKGSFQSFRDKVAPIFAWLKEHSGIIAFILQKLAIGFVVGLAIQKVIKPIFMLIGGLRFLLTWSNLLFAAMTFLGYAWKNNLGGLRDIVADVWGKIQGPLQGIADIFGRVKAAFDSGGLSAAFAEFGSSLGSLGGLLGELGTTIFAGIAEWVGPFIDMLIQVGQDVAAWAQGGGFARAFDAIGKAIGDMFANMGSGDGTIITGILGMIGGIAIILETLVVEVGKTLLADLVPGLIQSVSDVFGQFGSWISNNGRQVMQGAAVALGLALAGVLEFAVPALFEGMKKLVDLAVMIPPMIPDIVSALVTMVATLGAWLIGRGIPLLVSHGAEFITHSFNKIGAMLPTLGQNLGRLLTSTISKVVIMLVTGLAGIATAIFTSARDGTLMKSWNAFCDSIGNLIIGVGKFVLGFLVGMIEGFIEPFRDIGDALIMGLGEGIDAAWVNFYNGTFAIFDGWMEGIKQYFGLSGGGGAGGGWGTSSTFSTMGASIIDGLWLGLQNIIQMGINYVVLLGASLLAPVIAAVTEWINTMWSAFVKFHMDIITSVVKFVADTIAYWTALKAHVTDTVMKFLDGILDYFIGSKDNITTTVTGLKDDSLGLFSELDAAIRQKISAVTTWLTNTFITAKNNVITAVTGLKTGAVGQMNLLLSSVSSIATAAKETLNRIWSNIRDNALTLWSGIKNTARDAFNGITGYMSNIGDNVKSALSSAWESVGSTASRLFEEAANKARDAFDAIKGKIRGVADDVYNSLFGDDGAMGRIKNKMGELWGQIAGAAGTAFSGVSGTIKDVINDVIREVNKAIRAINEVAGSLGLPTLDTIPMLAIGTQFFQGGFAMVGENGPERVFLPRGTEVTPASQTLDMFERASNMMIDKVMSVVERASTAIEDSAVAMAQQLQAAAAQSGANARNEPEVIVTNTVESNTERHDHWNLTVNTQATTPAVVHDYKTMQAIAAIG